MNWKALLYFLISFPMVGFFFFSFATFLFAQQEEMQLFIPTLNRVFEMISGPGGFLTVCGMGITQYYVIPWVAAASNALFISLSGVFTYLILRKIYDSWVGYALSLFIIFFLTKSSLNIFYEIDATIGVAIILLMLCLYSYTSKNKTSNILAYGSIILVFMIGGQMVLVYTSLLIITTLFLRRFHIIHLLCFLALGGMCFIISAYICNPISLFDGLKLMSYHETRLSSDSLIYYVWFRFALILVLLYLAIIIRTLIVKKLRKWIYNITLSIVLVYFGSKSLPGYTEVNDRMYYQLSYMSRFNLWDGIINMHMNKRIPSPLNSSYLNMALAGKSQLGNKLFCFDQYGAQGLIPAYDNSYFGSVLLSDIYYNSGDFKISESYAMEALTMSRRGGSPRMLQRITDISIRRKEYNLAKKYIAVLSAMPCYKGWSARKLKSINSEVSNVAEFAPDSLMSSYSQASLWKSRSSQFENNRVMWEYMGSSFLLSKKEEQFKEFLFEFSPQSFLDKLPVHFQEAALMILTAEEQSKIVIDPQIKQKYESFSALKNQQSPEQLYSAFGNTFWYYYIYKTLS